MYERFFGFKERPFKLVPNPAYLYLSPSHEEALAHLTYAIDQGDGFVLITGEVGTGKTTLCRVFLEGLPEATDAAFIFNPKLTAVGLLQAINAEFGLAADSDNAAALTATLNAFLIDRCAQGRHVLLLVDEAQNLARAVLEQLRLLSNLETTTSKLLQIILVGQPELTDLLESHDLRQLNQRITLCCHVRPLTPPQTRGYILHRMQVAAQRPMPLMTAGAHRRIFAHTGGIPRLINILCDRALLVAYGRKRRKVTSGMVSAAAAELATGALRPKSSAGLWQWGLGIAGGIGLAFGVWAVLASPPAPVDSSVAGMPIPVPQVAAPSPEAPADPLADLLAGMTPAASRQSAMAEALARWQVLAPIAEPILRIDNDRQFFYRASAAHGLNLMVRRGDIASLVGINLPAIMAMNRPDGTLAGYVLLDRVDDQQVRIKTDPEQLSLTLPVGQLSRNWSGLAFVPWRDFYRIRGEIPGDVPPESIRRLKKLLGDIGIANLPNSPDYDPATRAAVMAFQRRYGIEPDGIVGPATKIVLYNALDTLTTPGLATGSDSLASVDAQGGTQ